MELAAVKSNGLSAANRSKALTTLILCGNSVGFAAYSASTSGTIDVIISNVVSLPIERGITFSEYLP